MREVLSVRRFTALDMFGTDGTLRRRRIVLAEFVVGCPLILLVGALTLRSGQALLGVWVLGIGVNYLPLAAHAVCLFPSGRLQAELAGVDVRSQLRRAAATQLLLLVPFIVAVTAAVQFVRDR